jgi:hypothetical protein
MNAGIAEVLSEDRSGYSEGVVVKSMDVMFEIKWE